MNLLKRIFNFTSDDNCVIGLCKFNDEFFEKKLKESKISPRFKKDASLTDMLRRGV